MIFRAFVARRELLRAGRGRGRDPHHRFALLARGDRAARVREPLAPPAHVDRPRGRRRPGRAAREPRRRAEATRPVVITPTAVLRRPTPGEFAEHLGLTYRPDPRLGLRSRRRRHRAGRSRGRGVRRVGRARHDLARRGRDRRPGRIELAHRELRRLPERHLGRGAHAARRDPGACGSARGSTRRAKSPACASRTAST